MRQGTKDGLDNLALQTSDHTIITTTYLSFIWLHNALIILFININ